MPAPTKTKKFESLTKFLQKRYKNIPLPTQRSVLNCLIYAALLENATFEQADQAFTALDHYYIDWNEMRVSTASELADVIPAHADPLVAAERIRRTLQGIFDKTYSFDLEELRKKGKNLSSSCAFLESIRGCTPFMVAYTAQTALDGHIIPLDEASLRIFRLLGLAQVSKDGTKEEVPGLERAIIKKNGLAFAAQLHHFAAGYFCDPESAELRSLLKPIDPEAVHRNWLPPALTVSKEASKKEKTQKSFDTSQTLNADFNGNGSPKDNVSVEEEILETVVNEKIKAKPEKNISKPVKTEPPKKADNKPVVTKTAKKPEPKKNTVKPNAIKPGAVKQEKKMPPKQQAKPAAKSPTHQLRSKKPK